MQTQHPSSVSIILLLRHDDKLLRRCISSLIQQTLPDIEIIVSDATYQGFTDALSRKLCNSSRQVRILTPGEGITRWLQMRQAVQQCASPYIIFINSNRWLEQNAAEVLLHNIEGNNADVVEMRTSRCIKGMTVKNDNPVADDLADRILKGEELRACSRFIGEGSYISPSLYDKLYRRELLLEALAVDYPADGGCEEILNIQYMRHARSLVLLSYAGVNYNWQEDDVKKYSFSDLADAKQSFSFKLLSGQDRDTCRDELETRLRRHISYLVLDMGWTREAITFFMKQELDDPFWNASAVQYDVGDLLRHVDSRDRWQDLTRVLRRLLK